MRCFLGASFGLVAAFHCAAIARSAEPAAAPPAVVWPLDRTAYFIGEQVPLAMRGVLADDEYRLEAVHADGPTLLYQGRASVLLLDTELLAPGDYALQVDGRPTGQRLTLTSPLRKSAGSLQDEVLPPEPQFHPQRQYTPAERDALRQQHGDRLTGILRDAGLTAVFPMAVSDMGRAESLDTLARAGVGMFVNPDTRPTSFFPVGNHPEELDGMSQRLLLTAQANGRYPNFAGFALGWDTTGYAVGGRRGLLTYWGWGDKTQALRNYLDRIDQHTKQEFTRRTGLQPVAEAEYIAYLLALQRPEFAPAIDLPTRRWLEEIAQHSRPMDESQRAAFERRLDAWSAYLMGLYRGAYGQLFKNLRSYDATLSTTASVQIDHAAVRFGQYFPSAYEPLSFQYQSTWNDQVGGPDYAYQWLYTAGLLDMHRGGKPTWLSTSMATVHGRAQIPGKLARVAAHGLAWGVSGAGFALEGFSNVLGGMNRQSSWEAIQGQTGEADVRAGRDFLDRFSCLAVEGRGAHGVGILFSRSQFQRQHTVMGFGTPSYRAFVTLTRLGYTPRFVTEEDLLRDRLPDVRALVVIGQTFALPPAVTAAIQAFAQAGGRVVVDDSTTVAIPAGEKLGYAFPFTQPGKPHNWSVPNMTAGENDAVLAARWHAEIAPWLAQALGPTGRGVWTAERGVASQVTLTQIDGGPDARYVVAVNDSHVQTQADWHAVRETLVPLPGKTVLPTVRDDASHRPTSSAETPCFVYDCTEEKSLGPLGPLPCDLTATTARVFAVLAREPKRIDLSAESLVGKQSLTLAVSFRDAASQALSAVIPFHLAILRPDGRVYQEFYRATHRDGTCSLRIPIPQNSPDGRWSLVLRCQLNGDTVTWPFQVQSTRRPFASPWPDRVVVRRKPEVEATLTRGAKLVLPIFDSPLAPQLRPVAEKVRQVLAARGVEVEIRTTPQVGTYTLAYELTAAQQQENARADRGEMFGKIRRETVNGNDWFSALSGWRFGLPVILLDLAGQRDDNPPAEAMMSQSQRPVGILWPEVSDVFPGPGGAVVQAVPWAFAPRVTAVVLQARDVEGLLAGAAALAQLPDDRLTAGIDLARTDTAAQYHLGVSRPGEGNAPRIAEGLQSGHAPQPFVLRFPGAKPLPADQVRRAAPPQKLAVALPGTLEPKQFVLLLREQDRFLETATAEPLMSDLRFSDALLLVADVPQAGKWKIMVDGVFRYSDRKPCWQAQWEDVIELRERLVPKQRRPMVFDVQLAGQPAGRLVPIRTEQKEVPLQLAAPSAGLKPQTAVEEVVTRLAGEIELPAGRQEIVLIHRNSVDGKVTKIEFGK